MKEEIKDKDEFLDNDIEEKQEEKAELDSEFIGNTINLYLKSLPGVLTTEEEEKLGHRILEGDADAKNTMIEKNLGLVVSIAKNYQGIGLELEDIIQNGNLGLIKAVERFDIRKGYKFSTFATQCIRRAIIREAEKTSRNIVVPSYFEEFIRKYKVLKKKLIEQYGMEPSKEEMARKLNVSIDIIEKCEYILKGTVSLNSLVGNEKEPEFRYEKKNELGDILASDDKTPEEVMLDIDLREKSEEILNSGLLTPKELKIIRLRFGFDGRPFTLEEIGQIIGVTQQRIKQIEVVALRKLRLSRKRYMIESYSKVGEDKGIQLVSNDSSNGINYSKIYQKNKRR